MPDDEDIEKTGRRYAIISFVLIVLIWLATILYAVQVMVIPTVYGGARGAADWMAFLAPLLSYVGMFLFLVAVYAPARRGKGETPDAEKAERDESLKPAYRLAAVLTVLVAFVALSKIAWSVRFDWQLFQLGLWMLPMCALFHYVGTGRNEGGLHGMRINLILLVLLALSLAPQAMYFQPFWQGGALCESRADEFDTCDELDTVIPIYEIFKRTTAEEL